MKKSAARFPSPPKNGRTHADRIQKEPNIYNPLLNLIESHYRHRKHERSSIWHKLEERREAIRWWYSLVLGPAGWFQIAATLDAIRMSETRESGTVCCAWPAAASTSRENPGTQLQLELQLRRQQIAKHFRDPSAHLLHLFSEAVATDGRESLGSSSGCFSSASSAQEYGLFGGPFPF